MPGEFHGQRSLAGSRGSQRVGHVWVTFTFLFFPFHPMIPWLHNSIGTAWVNLYNGFAKCSGYLFLGSSKLCALKHQWSFILLPNESSTWAEFTDNGLTLFHTVSVEVAQLGARGFILKETHPQGWQAGDSCWLVALQGCELEVLALLHESCFFMAYWASSQYGNWVKHEHLKRRCGRVRYFDDLSW